MIKCYFVVAVEEKDKRPGGEAGNVEHSLADCVCPLGASWYAAGFRELMLEEFDVFSVLQQSAEIHRYAASFYAERFQTEFTEKPEMLLPGQLMLTSSSHRN